MKSNNKLGNFTKALVLATSEGLVREEEINLKTNVLFKSCKSIGDIESTYEEFWGGKVIVLGIRLLP